MKQYGKNSGRSKSQTHPNGQRRKSVLKTELAPRSLRAKHMLLSNCTDDELKYTAEIERS